MRIKITGLLLAIILLSMTKLNAQNFLGDWKGSISIQGVSLELIFRITESNGIYASTLDVPMQGASGIAVDKTEIVGDELKIAITAIGASYAGKLQDEKIAGVFKQMGAELPLELERFESKIPGNPDLVTSTQELKKLIDLDKGEYKYSVADYFARPKASSFKISPNGKYISYLEKDEANKNHVYVKDVSTDKVVRAIEEKDELIKGYGWINDNRLYYLMDKGGDENFHIYAVNIDGSDAKDLTPFDGVKANILALLKEQKDYIIISMNKNNPQVFEPYRLNVVSGALEQLFENDDPANPVDGYSFDKDGNLRGYSKLVNGVEMEFWYKDLAANAFSKLNHTKWDDSFNIVGFNYASSNPDEAYVLTNLNGNLTEIVLYDLKQNKEIKKVFSNPEFDVSGIRLSRKRNWEVDCFIYEGEKTVIIPVSDIYKGMTEQMMLQFPNKEFYIVGFDDNETQFLILTQSDKHYGSYHLYDAKSKQFRLLYNLMPQLKEEDMAEMRPIKFQSRDGLTIHGYITLPKEAIDGKKVPLVVNPHGGPQGIRDSWGFNPETQLFASRGYATLQVNFRISGGYGKEFLRAGFKQIGRKLMDDVEDGVKYAISQGWADESKIAIYGGSHGGYATLMGLVKTPDLYVCGVDYVGVSNIETFFASFPEYWKPFVEMVKEVWYDLDNPEEAAIAREVSPVFQIDKISKPLFVVQGANDPRVNINESDQIVEVLRARGFDVPYMVKYNEGHGFYREENMLEFYSAMLGFMSQYLND